MASLNNVLYNSFSLVSNSIIHAFEKLEKWREDTEIFKKVGQVAESCLRLAALLSVSTPFPRLTSVVTVVALHDFYRFLKIPVKFIFPIDAEAIDDEQLLTNLVNHMNQNNQAFAAHQQGTDEGGLKALVRSILVKLLKNMYDLDYSFRDVDQFKNALQERFDGPDGVQLRQIGVLDLTGLKIPLKPVFLLDRKIKIDWLGVDIATVLFNCKEWNLVDTAHLANQVGRYSALSLLKSQSLLAWVLGAVCLGYSLEFAKAGCQLLFAKHLTGDERKRARWSLIASLGEAILFGSLFLDDRQFMQIPSASIFKIAIFSRSLGILSIVNKPAKEFCMIRNQVDTSKHGNKT
jgi:hypothetical protein